MRFAIFMKLLLNIQSAASIPCAPARGNAHRARRIAARRAEQYAARRHWHRLSFDIAVPGAPRRGFALMDQGPCADWKETQRRALSKTVQRRQFSQMRARSPALHRLERKFIWMTEPDRARRLFRACARTHH